MAELYEQPKLYANRPAGVTPISGDPDLDKVLAELPPEEREMAMQKITAPPTGEEIAQAMQERNANGELFNMTLDQYRLYKAHQKNKEVDIISTFGQAASGIYDEITKAGESIVNNPANAVAKLTPSLIEAFAQGTRNLYGMAAQSVDPSSVMFRMKNALSANGSDEEAEYRQFMEAQQFNVHSMNLMTGKETLVMDKDVINPEMTQVMSYVADPTLFIPFGGIAMKGARMVGMGEGLAKASARASMIRNKVLGGTLKWGVGAPIEFMGSAVRNTIDYGLERGSQAFEFATGMPAAEARATAQMYGLQSTSAALSGQTIPLPMVGNVAGAMVGSTTARGVGEALVTLGDQIYKQSKHGRGVLSYAGQALRDTEKSGVVLSNHAKGLLKVIDMADPLFVYSADIAEGAVHGMGIGGGLGYLAGGEEGMASGAGAGFALGAIGAGLGSVTADVTNNRLYDRIAIQRKMVIEGLRGIDDVKASALEAFAKVGEMNAERTGNRRLQAEIDGMIAGIDIMTPNAKFNIRSTAEHTAWLKSLKIDPKTGLMEEPSAILPQFGTDRKQRATALSFLSMVSDNFSGLPENLRQHIDALPADHAMKKHWARLSDDVKKVVMDEVKQNANIEYRKQFGGKKANEFYGDINYAEAHTARINSLFDSGNPTQARERINMLLKEETKGGKLTKRGELLKEKLSTEGYFDKDGNLRPSRIKEAELTTDVYKNVAGFVIRRDSTGQVEINLNTDTMGRDTAVHELFHAIMLESPMKDEFIDRLSTKLLGKFDANGKRLEGASVDTNQVKKFFQRYIDSKFRNNPTERANEMKRLERAVEEYEQRGDQNKVNRTTESTLEHMVEEFGAFYFPKFIQDKPVDFLFRGGELGAMREMFQSVKFGWLDFWRDKVGTRNPELNFDAVQGNAISQAFGKDGQPRYKNKALDLFMQDFVRATAMANRNGQFDITRLSNDAQKTFIKNNGIRGYGTIDKDGKVVRLNRRTALKEEMRVGKEIYKIVAGIDPKYRQGLTIDGEGNFSGRISPELAEELVKSGHVDRAWVDKLLRAYDIVDGKGSNVIEFGYLGRTAQIGDYAWPRLVGSDVPFKNRKAILLDVDFKVGKDGRMTALYHTLDHAVIEGRANTLWSDPAVRQLWDGDRGSMEADFFRYLSNASLPSDHPDRVSSAKLLEDGTGKGAMRRNAMHQMLGMAKLDGDVYINKPIAEIPLGIRHSVTTFNVDGVSGLRVREGARYDYNHRNAFRDLSRNFMMSEMASEETPNGKILKHGTGYKITKMAGSNRFSVFDVDGKELGRFDTLADAGRAAQKDYNKKFDAKVEGKDVPVPRTEVPPSRIEYIERNFHKDFVDFVFDKNVKETLISSIDKFASDWKNHLGEQEVSTLSKFKDALISNERDNSIIRKGIDYIIRNEPALFEKVSYKGKETILKNHFNDILNFSKDRAGAEYDAMYPMEIKSALHGRLAQIFQDYPNLTAQGLLKKLDVYGSQGYRYLQEAKEIGLIDLLKSKIKPKTEIYRKMDAQGNFTGEVATRELPVLFREISVEMKDEDGKVLTDENGYPIKETRQTNENIQGTQPVLDMQEILDFAKSKEIKLTIEEGAKEVNRMNTERLTLGGDKSNYKETAVRINPEYAHGIQGHYGENTVVHFRTTERLDAEGNKVLFIEEVQANNPYTDKTDSTQKRKVDVPTLKLSLNILNDIRTKGIDSGILVIKGNGSVETALGDLLDRDVGTNPYLWKRYKEGVVNEIGNILGSDVSNIHLDHIKIGNKFRNELEDFILEHHNKGVKVTEDDIFYYLNDALASHEVALVEQIRANRPESVFKFIDKAIELNNKYIDFIEKNKRSNVRVPSEFGVSDNIWNIVPRLDERISDLKTGIQQAIANEKSFPLTRKKDWTLTALKGIIRQAIRDGFDTITLTHPDDSPTVSNMDKDARHGLYGKIIPDTWGSWLRKYGIEIGQQNKLRDVNMETARGLLVEVQNKIPDANKAVMDRFQQVMTGEDPAVIKKVSELLSTPVHEADRRIASMISIEALGINDNKLRDLIGEVALLKGSERDAYSKLEKIREGGVRAVGELMSDKPSGISAEAIDRGMTFKLNDAIKRDFLDGKIKTHAMPTEGEGMYQGGRTYNQNSKKWKSGFIGLWAEENPEKLKGYNIEFFQKEAGAYRIRLQDNSVKGRTVDVGHITAVVSGDTATISSKIANEYQGNKLSYALYSEMAERLRAMGIRRVDGQIVNKDGVPIRVRERIIGDTRDYFSGKPIDQVEGARRIREKQEMVGDMGGVDVYNELYQNARYQPAEGGRTYTAKQMDNEFIGRIAEENPELTKGLKLYYGKVPQGMGAVGVTLRNKKGDVVANIKAMINRDAPNYANIEYSEVTKKQQGKGFGKLVYSELIERLRSLGVEEVSGTVIDNQGRPQAIRRTVIDDVNKGLYKEFSKEGRSWKTREEESTDLSEGMDVTSYLHPEAHYQSAEDFGIQATEGFKWFKRSKYNNIPKEREIAIDKILTDVFENKMSYAEAAKANNETRVNVAKLVKNYVKNNPSASSLIPSEVIKKHKFKWYVPDTEAHAYSLSKAVKIDEAMDDVISKSMLIKDSARKHSIDIDVLTYAIRNARERGSSFEYQLGGVGSNTRSKELYSLNSESGRMKISEENRNAIRSMYFDEGYSQKQVAESFGISKAIVQDILKERKTHLMPAEGGRTYTDEQFRNKFIGRYAEENKIFGLRINATINRTAGGRSKGDNRIKVQITKGNDIVGYMDVEQFGNTSAVIDYAEIKRQYQGGGFGNLLYSEVIERLRSLGVKDVSGMVIDNNDRPIQIRKTIIDEVNAKIGGDETSIDATRLDEEGNKQTDVTSYLEPKAWYMMAEGWRDWKSERTSVGSVIKNTAGYLIMVQNGKFKVYNPAKAMIGIYDNEEQAKRRVQKDEPRR